MFPSIISSLHMLRQHLLLLIIVKRLYVQIPAFVIHGYANCTFLL